MRTFTVGGKGPCLDPIARQQGDCRGNVAHRAPATRQCCFGKNVDVSNVVEGRISVSDGPDSQNHVVTRLVVRNHAGVLGAGYRQHVTPVDITERCAVERGALECLVGIPTVFGDEVFMLGSRVRSGVGPVEIDRPILDFSQMPTTGGLSVDRGEQGNTPTGDLPVNRALQRSPPDTTGKPFEGLAHTLGFVLRSTAILVQAFLAKKGPRRRFIQVTMGGDTR
ncbi:hypothetical protein D3C85_1016120 [compost metagenome]